MDPVRILAVLISVEGVPIPTVISPPPLDMLGKTRSRSPDCEETDERPAKVLKADKGKDVAVASSAATPVNDLRALLDLSEVKAEDLPKAFDRIAEKLIHHSRLQVTTDGAVQTYQLLEIEFYLRDSERHSDPFTHGEEDQKLSGRWYFHRTPKWAKEETDDANSPAGYRSGSRKGLDLTFAGPLATHGTTLPDTKDMTVRGGILLRTIRRISDKKIVSGPSLLVDELLSASKTPSIPELVKEKWAEDITAFRPPDWEAPKTGTSLIVIPHKSQNMLSPPQVYTSPRIGLDLGNRSESAARIHFVDQPYRYFIQPNVLTVNGRIQTFSGLFRKLKVGKKPPYLQVVGKIVSLTGLQENVVKRYISFYEAGKAKSLDLYVGPNGRGVSSSPEKFLGMLGALEKRRG
ncbi:hypothetical protein FRB99_004071 [Tulasnella sp. 403]|nr:hypothetical protein FRB99_004071 [Tulasnella sp. 403]